MTSTLAQDLAALTGEELYHLAVTVAGATATTSAALFNEVANVADWPALTAMFDDLIDVRNDVLLQFARIPVALGTAQVMIRDSQARYHRLVPVPGTQRAG